MGKLFILVGDFFWFLVLVACFVAIIVFLIKKSQKIKKTPPTKKNGFTLIELLVVLAIIAILTAIVVLIINPGKFAENQPLSDEQLCASYKRHSVQNLPVMCLKYYGVSPVINTDK